MSPGPAALLSPRRLDSSLAAGRDDPERGAYREFAPPPALREFVACFWQRGPGGDSTDTTIVPDGCVDVIWQTGQPPVVAGPMTRPFRSPGDADQSIAGVRFRPGAGHLVLGLSLSELRDRHEPLRAIWTPREISRWDAVDAGQPASNTVAAMNEAVSARVRALQAPDRLVRDGAVWIARNPGGRIKTLSQFSGLSERQVRRRFDDAFGYGPKTLQRIFRLQYLLWLASERPQSDFGLAALAYAAGYADQPHMTREVTALAGTAPRQLLLVASPRSAIPQLFRAP